MSGIYSTIKTSQVGSSLDYKDCNRTPKLKLKAEIPQKTDIPIFGLKSLKNYIVSNATEAILSGNLIF